MIQANQKKGISLMAAVALILVGGSLLMKGISRAVPGIIFWAAVQSMAGFYALLWAMNRPDQTFYSVFVADALLRLVSLAVITGLLWCYTIPFTVPLLTLAMIYLLFSWLQIPFFHRAV